MITHLRPHLILLVSSLLLCCVAYPIVIWAVAWTVTPTSASGGLILDADGKPVGSLLIAQEFKGEKYFHPRPSAVSYQANASGASNYGGSNPKLTERVEEQLKSEYAGETTVPADAVTTSGSGLDPHLTLAAAKRQIGRVATARKVSPEVLEKVLTAKAFTPLSGLAGEPLVNVLEINLELDRALR